jgi:mannose-6-phosphate isomerase-like protein (cupin superfamily)
MKAPDLLRNSISWPAAATFAVFAFSMGLGVGHFAEPLHAASAPMTPQHLSLTALKPDDISPPSKATGSRSKLLVAADGATISVQVGVTVKHYHADANEVQYVVEGTGSEWLGDKVVQLKPGDLLIIPKGTPHGGLTDGVKLMSFKTPPQAPEDSHPLK